MLEIPKWLFLSTNFSMLRLFQKKVLGRLAATALFVLRMDGFVQRCPQIYLSWGGQDKQQANIVM